MVVKEGILTGGRPITLIGGSDVGWIARSVLLQLKALSQATYGNYTLVYGPFCSNSEETTQVACEANSGVWTPAVTYIVRFRVEEGDPIIAKPIVPRPNPADDDWYNNVQIKLMEV
jgi:hypothetical protein